MDSLTTRIVLYLLLFVVVFSLPLFLCPKSSRSYLPIWSFYLVTTLALIVGKGWELLSREPVAKPRDGTPMSPVGGATIPDLLLAFGAMISVPIFLYVITLGLPWIAKGWPPDRDC